MKLAGHGSTAERLASVAELRIPRVESFTSVERLQTDLTACFGDPVSRPVVARPRIWRVALMVYIHHNNGDVAYYRHCPTIVTRYVAFFSGYVLLSDVVVMKP